ncbi:unnamed protein product [Ectocarpus sp. 4 AP-2014]
MALPLHCSSGISKTKKPSGGLYARRTYTIARGLDNPFRPRRGWSVVVSFYLSVCGKIVAYDTRLSYSYRPSHNSYVCSTFSTGRSRRKGVNQKAEHFVVYHLPHSLVRGRSAGGVYSTPTRK